MKRLREQHPDATPEKTDEVKDAHDIAKKIKVRFQDDEHAYRAFLEILCEFGNDRVCHREFSRKISVIFNDHHDLIEELERFIPNLKPDSLMGDQYAKRGIRVSRNKKDLGVLESKYRKEVVFCEKIKKKLSNLDYYAKFFECIHYYSRRSIDRNDFQILVAEIVKKDSDLVEEFNDILNCFENIAENAVIVNGHLSKSGKVEEKMAISIQDLDLSNCKKCTPSYRLLPAEYRTVSSQRSMLDAQVLNDCWVSKNPRRDSFTNKQISGDEEILFKCEEDRFEMDMLLNSFRSAVENVEKLLKSIDENRINLENPIPIEDHLSVLNLRCIERLYGEQGLEALDLLHEQPTVALPIILIRLKQKHEELTRHHSELNKIWADVCAKIHHKSVDNQQDSTKLSSEAKESEENLQEGDDVLLEEDSMYKCGIMQEIANS